MVENSGRPVWRRAGRVAAAALNGALLWLINVSPGWQSWSFLTADAEQVLLIANASLAVGLLVNAGLVIAEPLLLRGLAIALNATLLLVLLAKLFVVFPFAMAGAEAGWDQAVHIGLGLAMAGVFVALVAGLGDVARSMHVSTHLRRR